MDCKKKSTFKNDSKNLNNSKDGFTISYIEETMEITTWERRKTLETLGGQWGREGKRAVERTSHI